MACTLEFDTDYQKNPKYREINLTKQGEQRIEVQTSLRPRILGSSEVRVNLELTYWF
jgi:hypothetical protein